VYHSILGVRVIKKKKDLCVEAGEALGKPCVRGQVPEEQPEARLGKRRHRRQRDLGLAHARERELLARLSVRLLLGVLRGPVLRIDQRHLLIITSKLLHDY